MAITKNTRIYGNKLGFTINGIDFWADMASVELSPGDKDDNILTFADAAIGATSAWTLKGKAIQSTDSGSLWDFIWENAGKIINFIVAPHGNKTATAAQPHFTGKVKIGKRPPISVEAGDDKGATFDFEWQVVGDVEKTTSTSKLGTGSLEDTTSQSTPGAS